MLYVGKTVQEQQVQKLLGIFLTIHNERQYYRILFYTLYKAVGSNVPVHVQQKPQQEECWMMWDWASFSKAQIEPDHCPDGLLTQSVACNSDYDIISKDNIYNIIQFNSYPFWHPAPWASVLSPLLLSHSSPVSASCCQCQPWLHYTRSDYQIHWVLTEHELLEQEVVLGYLTGKERRVS